MTPYDCECGRQFTLAAHLANHRPRCLGPNPTLDDLYRIGHVDTSGECHLWNGKRKAGYGGGYGLLPPAAAEQVGEERAHRAAFVLAGGSIPDGWGVLHSCDNPPCVNPTHLRAGTQRDNMADMEARSRHGGRYNRLSPDMRACPICGTRYEVAPPSKRKDTCSRSCGSRLSWQTAPVRNLGGDGEDRRCPVCGTTFHVAKRSSRKRTCGAMACAKTQAWRTRRLGGD